MQARTKKGCRILSATAIEFGEIYETEKPRTKFITGPLTEGFNTN